MNKQEQRIAIAEACPHLPVSMGDYIWSNTGYIIDPFREIIIDPINDLNAMHEAEKAFRNDYQREEYAARICVGEYWRSDHLGEGDIEIALFATAAQRAEAFLKTIGKWEESK